ncbi:MAG: septum formation initiator family protein [Chloroflexi bacterium]|nr:septum formation initiator family protein [Chloroflexota bacterium]
MSTRLAGSGRVTGLWRFIIALAVLGFFGASFSGLVLSGYRLNQQAEALRRDIEDLKTENEQLQKQVRILESDEAIEKLAREKLGLAKPGETAIIPMPSKKVVSVPITTSPTREPTEKPSWRRWLEFLWGS